MGQAEMVLQLCLCTVLLRYVLGDVDFNLLDGFRYDKATVKMGESAISCSNVAQLYIRQCSTSHKLRKFDIYFFAQTITLC